MKSGQWDCACKSGFLVPDQMTCVEACPEGYDTDYGVAICVSTSPVARRTEASCAPNCDTCNTPNDPTACLTCSVNFVRYDTEQDNDPNLQNLHYLCLSECASGIATIDGECIREEMIQYYFGYFVSCLVNQEDREITLIGGDSADEDAHEPTPVVNRGLYFNDESQYLKFERINYGTDFSLGIWYMSDVGGFDGLLDVITPDGDSILRLQRYEEPNKPASLQMFIQGAATGQEYNLVGSRFLDSALSSLYQLDDRWNFLSFRIASKLNFKEVDGNDRVQYFGLQIRMYLDSMFCSQHLSVEDDYFEDSFNNAHWIGKDSEGHQMTGFIGDIWFINYGLTDFSRFLGPAPSWGLCDSCVNDCPLKREYVDCTMEFGNPRLISRMCKHFLDAICLDPCPVGEFYSMENKACLSCADDCLSCNNEHNCNKCRDPLCSECDMYDECTQCIANAVLDEFAWPPVCSCPHDYDPIAQTCSCIEHCQECVIVGQCLTCETGYFVDYEQDSICRPCAEECAECDGPSSFECNECKPGYVDWLAMRLCTEACPTGFSASPESNVCEQHSYDYCFEFAGKSVELVQSGLQLTTNVISAPEPSYQRGMYFDGNDMMYLSEFILSYAYTIQAWIKMEDGGSIFRAVDGTIDFKITPKSLTFDGDVFESRPIGHSWALVAVTVDMPAKSITFFRDNQEQSRHPIGRYIIDQPGNIKEIGAGYSGFMYSICMSQVAYEEFFVDEMCRTRHGAGFCEYCPSTACLIDCEFGTYLDSDSRCAQCDASCTNGCRYAVVCNQCDDRLCSECSEYDTCTQCVDNAEFGADGCECVTGFSYLPNDASCGSCIDHCKQCSTSTTCDICIDGYHIDQDGKCAECDPRCAHCETASNTNCTSCSPGNSLFPNDPVCEADCPTGFSSYDGTCALESDEISFIFQNKNYQSLTSNGVSIITKDSELDPVPAYDRGLYFDSNDFLEFSNLILNTQFTIKFWVRPVSAGAVFELGTASLSLSIDEGSNIVAQVVDDIIATHVPELASWHQLSIIASSDYVTFIHNGMQLGERRHKTQLLVDTLAKVKTLGKGASFFIYEISFYVKAIYQFDIVYPSACGDDRCAACPLGEDDFTGALCLTNCDIGQTFIDGSCQACPAQCEDGCIRTTDCRSCLQELAATCDTYQGQTSCITGADPIDGVCKCHDGKSYSIELEACGICPFCCEECEDSETCTTCSPGCYMEDEVEGRCESCPQNCILCFSGDIESCEACATGYFMFPYTTSCYDFCPTGASTDTVNHLCQEAESTFCFEFPHRTIDYNSGVVSLIEKNGSLSHFYYRGIHFGGDNRLETSGLILNPVFTLDYWICPQSDGTLFRVDDASSNTKFEFGLRNAKLLYKSHNREVLVGRVQYDKWT